MVTPGPPEPLPRAERLPAAPAPWGFFKGFLTGAAIEIPVLAATVWLLARQGIGNPDAGFIRIMRLTTVFAGVAALFTAGGIGRLAAYASAVGGRRRAMFVAARAHAVASGGLVVIAAIPLGHMPETSTGFIPIVIAGLLAGALCGALIGAVCGGAAPVGFADVWSLVRKPTDVLRQLLSPEDVVKLGSSLRTRTTNLFEGIFEPAAKRPTEPATPETEAARPADAPKSAEATKPPEAAKPAEPAAPSAESAKPKAE
ncbi:MAG: hypothetical protein IPQ07_37160 [Myxococcales bacterium]|nr:hypothetical protein [Myxococcales bacterium]